MVSNLHIPEPVTEVRSAECFLVKSESVPLQEHIQSPPLCDLCPLPHRNTVKEGSLHRNTKWRNGC